jgi:CDP-diglyceride synthetase
MKKLRNNRRASQLIEEGLLVVLALVMLGAVFTVSKNIIASVNSFFASLVEGLGDLANSLFGWLIPK